MKHRQRRDRAAVLARVSEPRAAHAHDSSLDAQKGLSRGAAETDQELRVGELDLSRDERQAGLGLLQRRRSIARRPPGNDIGDINLPSIESDGVQHAIQQLPGSPDEWAANSIFVPSWGLADKHDRGAWIAIREHELGCGPLQCAAVEIRHERLERLQIGRCCGQSASLSFGGFGRANLRSALPDEAIPSRAPLATVRALRRAQLPRRAALAAALSAKRLMGRLAKRAIDAGANPPAQRLGRFDRAGLKIG